MSPADVATARRWAGIYRDMGYNPLPSDPRPHADGGGKKPLCRYADWWESPAPVDLFDHFPTTNIQIMTGRFWRLAVLDLDGAEAIRHVKEDWPKLPRTWTSYHTGTGQASRHLWFTLPDGLEEKRRTVLWGGIDGTHSAVELLCDRCLVMAPPSIHPKTGKVYGFEGWLSPVKMRGPAQLPEWVWAMKSVKEPMAERVTPRKPISSLIAKRAPRGTNWVETGHLLGLIPDKLAVAVGWGLRLGRGGSGGWLYCHSIYREDQHPSAQFHPDTGIYWEPGRKAIGLLTLGTELGAYHDWRECRDALAAEYLT